MDIGLIPYIITPMTNVNVVDCWIFQNILLMVMRELDIGPRPDTIPPKEEIVGVMVQDVEVGLKISYNIPCSILEKVLMMMVEVDKILILALLHPIFQVILLYCQNFVVVVMTELDIGIRTVNFLQITMLN